MPPPEPDYRVVVEVGAHTFEATYPTTPAGDAVTLPLTMGWDTPEGADFFPTQANPTSGSFGIACQSLDTVTDLRVGDNVTVAVYTPHDAAEPWQHVRGVVSQLDAELGSPHRLKVYFTDPSWRLADYVVGVEPWPIETVSDRLDRICAEAGIDLETVGLTAEGLIGLLGARSEGNPTDALSAIRAAMKDTASRNISFDPDQPVYGRHVYAYDDETATLRIFTWERRPVSWPAELGDDGSIHVRPGEPGALLAEHVPVSGRWVRLRADRATYVIVDGIVFGDPDAPDAVPYVRNTSYVDGPGPEFPSATARAFLGRSLLPDGGTAGGDWRSDVIRHLSWLDPTPVERWVGTDDTAMRGFAFATLRPVIVDGIDPALTLDGRPWIAGLATSARLTIPPGGRFYTEIRLRPDLVRPFQPVAFGATTYADVPSGLAYADLDPLLTHRDLRLIGV